MKNTLTLVVALTGFSVNALAASPVYKEAVTQLGRIYEAEAAVNPAMQDNGYFSATLYEGEDLEDSFYDFSVPMNKGEIKNALVESLFTVFAYANPDSAAQNRMAKKFHGFINKLETKHNVDFNIFQTKRPIHVEGTDITKEVLVESCNVGGPVQTLLLQVDGEYSVLAIASDVCD